MAEDSRSLSGSFSSQLDRFLRCWFVVGASLEAERGRKVVEGVCCPRLRRVSVEECLGSVVEASALVR